MATKLPLAFLSYAHQDDEFEGGKLRKFAERLSGEVRLHSGETFPIFVDRNDVKWGQEWQSRIKESLSSTTFLIPILTPGYFRNEWCRKEFFLFLEREQALNRRDLILSVYYVRCPSLEDPVRRAQDRLAQVVSDRQYKDCRNLRYVAWTKPEVTRLFEQLALDIIAALERTDSAPPVILQAASEVPIIVPEGRTGTVSPPPPYSESVPAQPMNSVIVPPVEELVRIWTVPKPQEPAPEKQIPTPQDPPAEAAVQDIQDSNKEELGQTVVPLRTDTLAPVQEPKQIGSDNALAEAVRNYGQGNYPAALKFFCVAAKAGNGPALYNLGMMHELGLGVKPDLSKARGCYLRAARKHHGDAMNSLGLMYEQGEGVIVPSVEKARFWFRLGARHESAEALENLKRFED